MKLAKLLTLLAIGLLLGYFTVFFLPALLGTLLFVWLRRYVQPPDPDYRCTYPDGAQDVPSPADEAWIDWLEKAITKAND